ncbi:MAG: hypothetical protein ACKOWJ_04900 [Micrococcales bacterium]
MTTGCDVAMGIPSDDVRNTFLNRDVAVRANPGLTVFSVNAGRTLHGVLDTVLDFVSLQAATNTIEIKFDVLFSLGIASLFRPIAAWH